MDLASRNRYIGLPRINLDRVDSTNAYAWQQLAAGASEGTVVNAYEQYAGRGQRSNTWEAAPGLNITLSVILRPTFLLHYDIFMLNKIVSLAVARTLDIILQQQQEKPLISQVALQVDIKWPNDVLACGKKIAGLLLQNQLGSTHVEGTVVGVGININQTMFHPELQTKLTSLGLLLNKSIELDPVVETLMTCLQEEYERLRAGAYDAIDRAYLARLYRYQEWALYKSAYNTFRGMIVGVTKDGKLAVQRADAATNNLQYFNFKEIVFL